MAVAVVTVGAREFLRIAEYMIPADSIIEMDLDRRPSGEAKVQIVTREKDYEFTGERALALRSHFGYEGHQAG